MNLMFTLMRKDWRIYRAPVIGSLSLGLLPYALCALLGTIWGFRADWVGLTENAAILSLASLAITAGAFGGMAWAAERTDRSAMFLAVLPPTRSHVAASKLAVAAGWLVACFALDAAVGYFASAFDPLGASHRHLEYELAAATKRLACFGVASFGVAWACSAVLSSSAVSAVVGVATGVVLVVIVGNLPDQSRDAVWFASSLTLGVASFLVGTAYYLRRSEP